MEVTVFEFGHLWVFWFLPLPLLVVYLMPPVKQRKDALIAPFFQRIVELTGEKPGKGVRVARREWLRYMVLILIWIAVVAALASPQIVGEPEKKIKTARSMMIAVDISGSMETRDWEYEGEKMTRWNAVREIMEEFIEKREGDRLGLMFLGSQAYLQVPFTNDLNMVNNMLSEVEVGMAGQRTAIGNAIGRSIELFEADSTDKKVLILITDGVDSDSQIHPIQAARTAAADSVLIYTIGMGDPNSNLFEIDEKSLKEIAGITGGEYFLAIDGTEMAKIYENINRLEPIEHEDESYRPVKLLFFWPLSAAFLLVILHQVISGIITLIKNRKWKNL